MAGSLEIYDNDHFTAMEKVASLMHTGASETAVGKQLGIPRKQVISLWEDYKELLNADHDARDLGKDLLNLMIKSYDSLMKDYYKLIDDLRLENFSHQVAAQINSALKQIADLQSKRLDAVQRAGLLDDNQLSDELAETQLKQEKLIEILRTDLCAKCQPVVARKLQSITGQVEVIRVHE